MFEFVVFIVWLGWTKTERATWSWFGAGIAWGSLKSLRHTVLCISEGVKHVVHSCCEDGSLHFDFCFGTILIVNCHILLDLSIYGSKSQVSLPGSICFVWQTSVNFQKWQGAGVMANLHFDGPRSWYRGVVYSRAVVPLLHLCVHTHTRSER